MPPPMSSLPSQFDWQRAPSTAGVPSSMCHDMPASVCLAVEPERTPQQGANLLGRRKLRRQLPIETARTRAECGSVTARRVRRVGPGEYHCIHEY
jgi:hypothetical protein